MISTVLIIGESVMGDSIIAETRDGQMSLKGTRRGQLAAEGVWGLDLSGGPGR